MKRIRAVAATLALSAVLFAPRAEAQVQLGWNSSLGVVCLNAGCTNLQFTLNLSGLKPTDNNGNAVPAAIVGLNSPGYVSQFTIDIFGGAGVFSSASVVSGGTWLTFLQNGALSVQNNQTATPYVSAPIVVDAWLTVGGGYNFGYSGLAYLGDTGACYNGATGLTEQCSSRSYRQGDFNGLATTVPEPMTMGLMATGLVGMALVGYRRRKQQG